MPQYAREPEPEPEPDRFARSRAKLTEMLCWLDGPQAAGLEHGELEDQVDALLREAGRLAVQDHLDAREAREHRLDQVTGPDGIIRRRAERRHQRQLVTIFGKVTTGRIAYRAPGLPDVHVADAELNLPREMHSHGLRRRAAIEAARGSFEDATAAVARATGVRLGKRQAGQLTRRAAADAGAFNAARQPAPASSPGDVMALECDSKGIVVLPGQMRPGAARDAARAVPRQQGRLSRGEVRNRKRMAEAGAVFDFTPAPRTTADIIGPPAATAAGPPAPAPDAANTWYTASVTASAAAVIAAIFAEADRRDPGRQRTWVALADGNKHQIARIEAEAAARDITVPVIIDFIHVTEYLWTAAWCFHPEASPAAGSWVREHAAAILDGRAADVAAAISAQIAATANLSRARQAAAARTVHYLQAKARWLDYPQALANGWPISTGIIEGACRHLIKDRMDITGARWGTETAEAILKLRALIASGDFDDYWTYHLQRERARNHPINYQLAA